MRTSTFSTRPAPTGWISPSCRARSSFACTGAESSPTSSSTSVPRFACAKNPSRALVAPVNAPRAWPKSSASASSPGMAAQLKRMRGPAARRLSAWMSEATSSLPVPVSPRMSTVMSFGAIRLAASRRRCIAGDSPTMVRPIALSALSRRFWTRRARASTARSITSEISSISPVLIPSTTASRTCSGVSVGIRGSPL